MSYLTIGTDELLIEKMAPITNNEDGKPRGGLWATVQTEYNDYNSWLDYLTCSVGIHVLYYKYASDLPYLRAAHFELKKNANILNIETNEDFKNAMMDFSCDGSWLDFEKIATFFDGIYINTKLCYTLKDFDKAKNILNLFSVSSLILFNLDCVEYYQKASVKINNNGFSEYGYEDITYVIEIEDEKRQVYDHQTLIKTKKAFNQF